MLRQICLVLHLVSDVLWIGGAVTAAWTAAQLAIAPREVRAAGLGAVRRALLTISSPAMVLAVITGLVMLIDGWSDIYRRAAWMHTKFTTGFALAGVTGILTGRVRKAVQGKRELTAGAMGAVAIALALGAVTIVALVILRPGA